MSLGSPLPAHYGGAIGLAQGLEAAA